MSSEISPLGSAEYPGESQAKSILGRYLTPGETLQWSGRPQWSWSRDFKRSTPVALFFLIIFFFLLVNFLTHGLGGAHAQAPETAPAQAQQATNHQQGPPPLIVMIFVSALAAAFLSFWCYMMFRGLGGQRLLNFFSLSHTYYGLTDRRIIVVAGKKEFKILSYHLRSAEGLRLREDADGVGTINLGPRERTTNPFQAEDSPPLILKNIPRAAYVFGLIFKAQDKLLEK